MKYEIEFIGINQGQESKNADAICFRYYDNSLGRFVTGVYDGGFKEYGVALKNHLNKYYFSGETNPTIDYVFCSHSDQDHASGLEEILNSFQVGTLIMNRPWLYINELFPKISDGRITPSSLEHRLRETYPYINKLESIALENGIDIQEGFRNQTINEHLAVLSPSKEFYLQLLVASSKTPLQENAEEMLASVTENVKSATESWTNELIREDVHTSAENESSIIVLGDMQEEKFLLTGDAGIQALRSAADYAEDEGNICNLNEIDVHQIPHHGGRRNVSPSVLNRVVGNIIPEGTPETKTAIVSVSTGSDYPKKMVVNAYIRRGAKVYVTRSNTLRHYYGDMPRREGWKSANKLEFSEKVEDWDS